MNGPEILPRFQMNFEAVKYYRQHRRVVEALVGSDCIDRPRATPAVDLQGFLESSEELRELERRTEAFNLFAALGVAEAEIRHSRLLAWLLSPEAATRLERNTCNHFWSWSAPKTAMISRITVWT